MVKIYTLKYGKIARTTIYVVAVLLWVLFCNVGKVNGQTYATSQFNGTTGPAGNATITFAQNAVTTPYTDSCHMVAASVLGTSTAYLHMIFGATVPANTTVYIKYKSTGALLGGGIALQAYSGSATPSTAGATVTTTVQDLTAPDGTKMIAVTGSGSFNAIRITLSSPIALGTNTADIFYAYYLPVGAGCNLPVATTTSASGVTLGTLTNPNNAIDGNVTTASDFSFVLGLGGSLTETLYYQGVSSTGDAATLTLSVPAAVLSLGLFNSTTVTAFNGPTQVGTPIAVSSVLSLDLLGLMGSGNPYTVSLTPTGPFDRIAVTFSGVNLLNRLFLHEVTITTPKPTFTLPINDTVYVCSGGQAVLKADPPGAGKELRWYASALATNTTLLHTGDSFVVSNVTADTVYWVASGRTGCTASSERVPVRVLVRPLPGITFSTPLFICQKSTIALLSYTAPVNNPATYSITWGALAVTAGFANVANTTLPASPVSIVAPATAPPQSYPGTFFVRNALGCQRSYPFALTVQATPHPPPPSTTYQ